MEILDSRFHWNDKIEIFHEDRFHWNDEIEITSVIDKIKGLDSRLHGNNKY
mgnify:CR=1 FL=1